MSQCGRHVLSNLWLIALAGLMVLVVQVSLGEASERGRTIDDFALRDVHGRPYKLAEVDSDHVLVLAFLGTECPLAKLYAPRLVDLHEEFSGRSVRFWGIDSNRQDSMAELEHFARVYGIAFPLLRDPGNRVADLLGAKRTPEVFVLDRNRRIRYRGRIDDQYGFHADGRGFQRNTPHRRDLATALKELLTDHLVSVPETQAFGCLIGRVREPDPNSPVTWSKQIAPIFQRRCQICHREGEIAPFPLERYEEVQGWEAMIREVVQQGRMPPWHADSRWGKFANDTRLSDEEKRLIFTWIDHGVPRGDPGDLPKPRQFSRGWQISKPDLVLYADDKPFEVPAEGVVEYQYFVVDPGFTEDRWIRAAEARPGNPAVVHHVNVFILPPGMGLDLTSKQLAERWELQSQMLCGFVPGMRPTEYPLGRAKRIPAGSRIVFQLHYTPNGSPQTDRSYVGLCFAEPADVRQQVTTVPLMNCWFEIPPNTPDYQVELSHTFKDDVLVLSFLPHMHLRGKSFRYEARFPDGRHEILLDVPHYDFNWQNIYVLTEPKRMPQGSQIRCVATFDNSADNLSNPDPSATVRWGDQTWDEMMIGYFDIVTLRSGTATQSVALAGRNRRAATFAAMLLLALIALSAARRWKSRNHRATNRAARKTLQNQDVLPSQAGNMSPISRAGEQVN